MALKQTNLIEWIIVFLTILGSIFLFYGTVRGLEIDNINNKQDITILTQKYETINTIINQNLIEIYKRLENLDTKQTFIICLLNKEKKSIP